MNRREFIVGALTLLCAAVLPLFAADASPDVFIGSSGLGHVTPAAAFPFGLVQAGPDTSAAPDRFLPDWPHTCGYQHGDEWLWRFSQTHILGTGVPSLGDFGILPCAGSFDGRTRPAKMLKETERAVPGYYAVVLDEDGARIRCEVTVLGHSAAYRFRFPEGARNAKLLLDLDWGIGSSSGSECWGKYIVNCGYRRVSDGMVVGGHRVFNWNAYDLHFAAAFSSPVVADRKLRDCDGRNGEIHELSFGDLPDGVLEVRLALSATSPSAALGNLRAEMPEFDFPGARDRSARAWDEALSCIRLGADAPVGTRRCFEAALYRTMLQPNNFADCGQRPAYSTFSLWDTFRAAHPLYTIIAPGRVADMVASLVDQCDRQGYLPIWALGGSDNHCMIGHHAVPVIVDAYLKGLLPEALVPRAYAAVRQSLTVNHHAAGDGTWGLLKEDWDILDKYGYYPFDLMRGAYGGRKVTGESVARTLECAYDDACAARFAERMGKGDDAGFFRKRAGNWRNVFDPSVGFMRGRDSKGRWREPFDPIALGGGPWTDNDFCEGNAWQYTWHVMQDPEGLIAAFGGREPFVRKLRGLFEHGPCDYKSRPTADVTGLIGQYAHGNEPSHHTIYFFTLAGRNDLALKYVKEVFRTQYADTFDGLCGNDDCGQMAAWYVFSTMGFYPFDPCGGEYVLGAPQVPQIQVKVKGEGGQRTFTVLAKGLSKESQRVKSVTLNGQPLTNWKIRHEDILRGGELVFEMSSEGEQPAVGQLERGDHRQREE